MIKFISFCTIICFFITNVCSGLFADVSHATLFNNKHTIASIMTTSDLFSAYGQVTYNSYKKNTPLVVVINDLHNNNDAQSNIEQIISFFKNNSNIDKIILEGAPNKKINTSLFSTIDEKSLPVVVDNMLSQGNISGAEAYIIKNKVSNSYGLENWNLYIENIQKNILLKNKYSDNIFYLLNSFVKIRTKYPKTEFLSTFTYTNDSNERIKKIIEFCNKNNIDLTMYPQLTTFATVNEYKNKKNINKDFTSLLNELKGNISYERYSLITELLKNSNKNPKYVMNSLFKILKEISPQLLLKYGSLYAYFKMINLQNSINYYLLFNELEILEQNISTSVSDKTEKELFEVDKFINLLSEYSNLSLTYQGYKYFIENKNNLYETSIKYLDLKSIEIINNILDDTELEKYYKINAKRNNIFYNNLKKLLNLNNTSKKTKENRDILNNLKSIPSVNIIVVGGFHAQLTDMLKQENVSVLSVIPNISNLTSVDNQMLRVNNIVYQSALAPPMVCVRTDLYSLAIIINSWTSAMTKRNIPFKKQADIISSWLNKNNINVDFKTTNNKITLNSKPISDILTQTQTKIKNTEITHKTIFNFLWYLNDLKLKFYSYLLVLKYTFANIFGYTDIENKIQPNNKDLKVKNMFISTEYQKNVDAINGAKPDVIIITLDNKEDKAFCENKINELLKNKDVRVEYIIKDQNIGSAAGLVYATDYLKSNKNYDKLKTVVIDVPHEDINLIRQELPLPFKDKNLTPLQLALLNGIRACNKFGDDGGIAFMEARSVYIGAMNITGDLTFISSIVNMEEIEEQNLALIIKNDEDRSEIEKFYYGFKPDDITDVVEKRGIATKNFYNFNNKKLEQFEVITGNMLIHFDDNDKYKQFIDFITDMKPAIQKTNERMSILKHLFKPYLRLSRNESHKTDLVRNTDMSSTEKRKFFDYYTDKFEENYKKRKDSLGNVKFSVYNHPYSNYSRNSTQDNISNLSNIVKNDNTSIDSYEPINKNNFELIEIPVETLANDSALKRTYEILEQINGNTLESKKDYDQILDILTEVFRTTYFQNELYTVENENTAKLYVLISDIISSSINNINKQISKTEDNSVLRQDLENLKRSLLVMQEYTVEYLRLLDYTSTLATLCGYIYPKHSIFETYKIMPVNRVLFGFTRGIKNAQIDVRNQMRKVQYLCNNKLMYSLYPYNTLEKDIEDFIESSQNPKEKTAVGMQKGWGTRRALQRFSTIITALQSCVATAFVAVMKSAVTASDISEMLQFLLTGLFPPVFLHRVLIWFGWKNDFYNKKKKEIDVELSNMKIQRNSAEVFIMKKNPFDKLDNILSQIIKDKNLNDEGLKLAEKNKELIKNYNEFYDLKIISEILNNNEQIIHLLSNNNLLKKPLENITKEYNDILDELTINYKQKKENEGEHFKTPKEIRINKLNSVLTNWKEITDKENLTAKDLSTIIDYSTEIIKLTSFNRRSLKGNNKDDLIDTLQDVISFYDKTVELYYKLPKKEREEEQMAIDFKEFNLIGKYFVKYYKSLNYLVTLETLYYYRISEGNKMHFLETFKIAAIIRYLFGINFGIFLSQKNLIATMAEVKQLGNDIMHGGLYDDNFEKNIDYFINKNKNPQHFDLGINESWRARKMLSRLVPTVLFIQKIIIALTTNSFSVRALSVSFATGVGLTIFLHWIPILDGFIKTMRIKEKKLKKMKENRNKQSVNEMENIQNSLTQKYLKNISKVPYGDMPDLIFVTGNKNQYNDEHSLKNTLKGISEYGKFKTVPTEFSITEQTGDGNSIIHAFNSITDNYDELVKKYPSLKDKKPQNLKIAILNIDGAKPENITKPLGFEIINGRQATAVELAFFNAVGMLQTNSKNNGNIAIADPSYLYLGNLYQEENITILGTDIKYEQLEEQNLPLLVADEDNKGIYKIFNKFNISKINNTVVRESYSRRYDISENPLIRLPAYSGLIGVNVNNIKVFNLLETAKNYVENYNGEKEEIDFIAHILIPILRIMNNEDMNAYIEILKKDAANTIKRDNIDKFYRGLFKEFSEFLGNENFDSVVNLKVEHSSLMTKNQEDIFYNEFVSDISALQNTEDNNIDIFDISNEEIKFNEVSVIATIDFNDCTPEQLDKIIENLPVKEKKIIIKNIYDENNPNLFNTESIEIDMEDKQIYDTIEKENEYKQQLAYKKYQKISNILKEKEIEQIYETDEDYYNLKLSDENNIEETLLNISKNNNGFLKISLDISDLFKDSEVNNNFNKLNKILKKYTIPKEDDTTILPIFNKDNIRKETTNNNISTQKIYTILTCA